MTIILFKKTLNSKNRHSKEMHIWYTYMHRHNHKIRYKRDKYISNAMDDSQNE